MIVACVILTIIVGVVAAWPHHTLVQGGKPYISRWPLLGGDGQKRAPWPLGAAKRNVFLHWIRASDGPAYHNHPWACKSRILWGSYNQFRRVYAHIAIVRTYRRGDINVIDAGCFHTLQLVTKSCWTLFWTEPKHGKSWGFLIDGKIVHPSKINGNARDFIHARTNRITPPKETA